MDLQVIFNDITNEFNNAKKHKIPISDLIRAYEFQSINKRSDDEYFHATLSSKDYRIEVSIKCYFHDRVFQSRPDTNHNFIELYKNNELVSSRSYMYEEDE